MAVISSGDGREGLSATVASPDVAGFDATLPDAAPFDVVERDVSLLTDASEIAFPCALRGDRTVWCCGDNGAHQAGDGGSVAPRSVPSQVRGLADAAAVTEHACALKTDGTVRCRGAFRRGQLGRGHLYTVTW